MLAAQPHEASRTRSCMAKRLRSKFTTFSFWPHPPVRGVPRCWPPSISRRDGVAHVTDCYIPDSLREHRTYESNSTVMILLLPFMPSPPGSACVLDRLLKLQRVHTACSRSTRWQVMQIAKDCLDADSTDHHNPLPRCSGGLHDDVQPNRRLHIELTVINISAIAWVTIMFK